MMQHHPSAVRQHLVDQNEALTPPNISFPVLKPPHQQQPILAEANDGQIFNGVEVKQLDLGKREFMATAIGVMKHQTIADEIKPRSKRRDPACADNIPIERIQTRAISPRPFDGKRPRQTKIGMTNRLRTHRKTDAVPRRRTGAGAWTGTVALLPRVGPTLSRLLMLNDFKLAFTAPALGLINHPRFDVEGLPVPIARTPTDAPPIQGNQQRSDGMLPFGIPQPRDLRPKLRSQNTQ